MPFRRRYSKSRESPVTGFLAIGEKKSLSYDKRSSLPEKLLSRALRPDHTAIGIGHQTLISMEHFPSPMATEMHNAALRLFGIT